MRWASTQVDIVVFYPMTSVTRPSGYKAGVPLQDLSQMVNISTLNMNKSSCAATFGAAPSPCSPISGMSQNPRESNAEILKCLKLMIQLWQSKRDEGWEWILSNRFMSPRDQPSGLLY
jgi:hypothetical protein